MAGELESEGPYHLAAAVRAQKLPLFSDVEPHRGSRPEGMRGDPTETLRPPPPWLQLRPQLASERRHYRKWACGLRLGGRGGETEWRRGLRRLRIWGTNTAASARHVATRRESIATRSAAMSTSCSNTRPPPPRGKTAAPCEFSEQPWTESGRKWNSRKWSERAKEDMGFWADI
jgi:hypothetical protein